MFDKNFSACIKDETFGLGQDHGRGSGIIWVNGGCRAQFRIFKRQTAYRKVKTAISCEWSYQVKGWWGPQGSQLAYPQCADGKTINIKKATYGRLVSKLSSTNFFSTFC